MSVRQTFEICRIWNQRPGPARYTGAQAQTILLMNRSSSSSRSRMGLNDVSLRGGLYKLKNDPGLRTVNACASIATYSTISIRPEHQLLYANIPQKLMNSSWSAFKCGSAGEDVKRSNRCSGRPSHQRQKPHTPRPDQPTTGGIDLCHSRTAQLRRQYSTDRL